MLGPRSRSLVFVLESDQAGPVTLSWAIATDLDLAQHFATLRDPSTGAPLADLWAQSSLVLNVTPGRRLLQIPHARAIAAHRSLPGFSPARTPRAVHAHRHRCGTIVTFRVVTGPAQGALQGTPPQLTYVPAPNFNGTDAFTFVANDGNGDSNLGTVAVTVLPMNDPPLAAAQSLQTDEDTALDVTLAGSDVDGDPLAFTVDNPPAHGVLSGTPPHRSTPLPRTIGTDAFTFRVLDGQAGSRPRHREHNRASGHTTPRGLLHRGRTEAQRGDLGGTTLRRSSEGANWCPPPAVQRQLSPVAAIDDNVTSRGPPPPPDHQPDLTSRCPAAPATPSPASAGQRRRTAGSRQALRCAGLQHRPRGRGLHDRAHGLCAGQHRVQEFLLLPPPRAA